MLNLLVHNVSVDLKFQFPIDMANILLKLLIVMDTFLEIMGLLLESIVQINLRLFRRLFEGFKLVKVLD